MKEYMVKKTINDYERLGDVTRSYLHFRNGPMEQWKSPTMGKERRRACDQRMALLG
jgi:hypothetical protein